MLVFRNMAHRHQKQSPCFAFARFERAAPMYLAAEGQDGMVES